MQGSILSFEFGKPRLEIREPLVSNAFSASVRHHMAQRRVKPGEWNLFIFACRWRVVAAGETLSEDVDTHERIEAAASVLDGQKLTQFKLDASSQTATFAFYLGATLSTWPYTTDEDEQWSLYLPSNRVLTYRADGRYSLGAIDEEPDQEVWHPVARS